MSQWGLAAGSVPCLPTSAALLPLGALRALGMAGSLAPTPSPSHAAGQSHQPAWPRRAQLCPVPSPLAARADKGPGVPVPGRAGERARQAAELPGGAGHHEAASGRSPPSQGGGRGLPSPEGCLGVSGMLPCSPGDLGHPLVWEHPMGKSSPKQARRARWLRRRPASWRRPRRPCGT